MTVLIDSWAWIEYFKGTQYGERARKYIESGEEILVSAINVSEVYRFLLQHRAQEAQQLIDFVLRTSFVIPIDVPIALHAARLKVEKKFGMADAIVLATAREQHSQVVTGDDDFKNAVLHNSSVAVATPRHSVSFPDMPKI